MGNRTRLLLRAVCVVARLALAGSDSLGELIEPGVAGIEVESDGLGVEGIENCLSQFLIRRRPSRLHLERDCDKKSSCLISRSLYWDEREDIADVSGL